MADNTFNLIASSTLTATASNVIFSSIPQTYTDLCLLISARDNYTGTNDAILYLRMNGLTSNYSDTILYTNGTTVSGYRNTGNPGTENYGVTATNAVANAFGSLQIYIPNYTSSNNKVFCSTGAPGDAATTFNFGMALAAANQTSTAAITTLGMYPSVSFASGSTFYLYGIKNS